MRNSEISPENGLISYLLQPVLKPEGYYPLTIKFPANNRKELTP
jgi:hypothetical protein